MSLSHIVTLTSYCKGQGYGMLTHHYFVGEGLNSSTHLWRLFIVLSSAAFYFSCLLESPLPI